MNVLMVQPGPAFSVADVHRGWTRAFHQLGCGVADLDLGDRLNFYSQAHRVRSDGTAERLVADPAAAAVLAGRSVLATCYELQPDVVVVTSGFYIHPAVLDTVRANGTPVVVLHTESPYDDDQQIGVAAHATLNVICDPTNLHRFQTVAPTIWLPHCYDPAVHHPGPVGADYRSQFCFVGTGYPSRVAFFEAVDFAEVDVALAGNWSALDDTSPLRKHLAHDIDVGCDNDETADLYRGATMSANLYRREAATPDGAVGWAMGPREVELAACGTFFLRDPRPEGDDVLGMLPTFADPEEFTDLLRWYLHHEPERTYLAGKARRAVAGRTFTANAATVLDRLERDRQKGST